MVSPLESWLAEIGSRALGVAFAASRYSPRRAIMMASRASLSHIRHIGMHLVVEMHRAIFMNKLVKQHRIRRLGERMFGGLLGPAALGARFEAWFRDSRLVAIMALAAIKIFGHPVAEIIGASHTQT